MNLYVPGLWVCSILLASCSAIAAEIPLLGVPEAELMRDNFASGSYAPSWSTNDAVRKVSGQARVIDGVLHLARDRASDHGAVISRSVDFCNARIRLRGMMHDARGFEVNLGDPELKTVHAGHIAQVRVTAKQITIVDQKTGVMNLAYRESAKKLDKAEAAALLVGKSASAPLALKVESWFDLTIDVVGDEVLVAIEGQPVVYLKSEGLGHPTKRKLAFSADVAGARFDDVSVVALKLDPNWPKRRADIERLLKLSSGKP
jgi:ribosomal protein L28